MVERWIGIIKVRATALLADVRLPPNTGLTLVGGWRTCIPIDDSRIARGVLIVSVINGELKEVCSAKVRNLGEKVGQAWRLHVHPQDSSKAAYVNRNGEDKWNSHD